MSQEYLLKYLKNSIKAANLVSEDALLSQELAEYLNDQDKLKHLRNEFFYPKMATLPHGITFFTFYDKK